MPPRDRVVNAQLAAHARSVKNFTRDLPRVWTVDRVRDPQPGDRLLTKAEVVALVGLSYQKIWQLMDADQFPRAIVIAGRNLWLESEIHEFIRAAPRRRLKNDPPLPALASDPPQLAPTAQRVTVQRVTAQRHPPPRNTPRRRAQSSMTRETT
jgi:predicted DNA-binding transcriptional regulator AlpA